MKKEDYSKRLTRWVIIVGVVISQECIALIAYAISKNFTSTAAYLTAAVGLAEAVIAAAMSFYTSLAKSDHSEGGITFEAAKAKNFTVSSSKDDISI